VQGEAAAIEVDKATTSSRTEQADREVVVTGVALRSGLGDCETTWKRLLAGETAIRPSACFAQASGRSVWMALIDPLNQRPSNSLELLDRTLTDLLATSGLVKLRSQRETCGVVIGSSRSQQRQWEQWSATLNQAQTQAPERSPHFTNAPASGLDFGSDSGLGLNLGSELGSDLGLDPDSHLPWLQTLPHAPALYVAERLGSRGYVAAPMAACSTGIWAIFQAYEALRSGQCDRVITGAVEAAISPLTIASFAKMGALADRGCLPFDRQRSGLVLGEGAALICLETRTAAITRQAKILGKIVGFGLTTDAHHISAPDPNIDSAVTAVNQALQHAHWLPEQVDFIHAHGTGTHLNDRREATLIQTLFPATVPVVSTKGATGHTLGVSGVLGAIFCLLAMRDRLIPPSVGTTALEFPIQCPSQAQPAIVQRALCFSFGFGGQNTILAIEAAS